jgi:hypothetical protein
MQSSEESRSKSSRAEALVVAQICELHQSGAQHLTD